MKDKFKIGDIVTIANVNKELNDIICTITNIIYPQLAKHSVGYYVSSLNGYLENVLMFEEELEFIGLTLQEYVERSVE